MTAEDVLVRMLHEFEDGRRWTRGYPLRDALGRFQSPYDWDAETRFCLMAMFCYVRDAMWFGIEMEQEVLGQLRRATGIWNLAWWNDQQPSFGPVRAVLLAAIEDGK